MVDVKKVSLLVKKRIRSPFYEAAPRLGLERFYEDAYRMLWVEAERELGRSFTPQERVDLMKELESVVHVEVDGVHYFFAPSLEDYWYEVSELIEERFQ
ncbi:MAG: hypothetical protein BLITH_0665 [Brockia lithotrophica]|uniref:Uncharacterized protein n=1 Tax=Brockia lithotrophica TaxID=933949 RepID=A0A2T5G8G8_9BACL|nr:hypothetical protein [Brockia lithotrophica]PTQ52486.1 MAG: hypothetical protein BLITH_0665 [Brockia lithotrophica]